MSKIKVLVVDDSALMRKIISDIINSDNELVVINTARNGKDLIEKLKMSEPDIITLDVEMPIMDGITALKEMKKQNYNIPTIMLSSVSETGSRLTMECLDAGAIDFIPKPSGSISLDIDKVKDELIEKIKLIHNKSNHNNKDISYNRDSVHNKDINYNRDTVHNKDINYTRDTIHNREIAYDSLSMTHNINEDYQRKNKSNFISQRIDAIVIGASTGGPKALYTLITALPKNLGVPVFVVQHMPIGFTKAFANRLDSNSKISVHEAEDNERVENDSVFIAPAGFHMEVGNDKKIHLNSSSPIWGVRPAVDKLFISAAAVYGPNIVSAVLTGMGKDGAQGTVEIKKNGGITISEAKSTCIIYGMPKVAYETGMVDKVLPIDEIAPELVKILLNANK
ncbi:MAG: chemotaxis response regulator protein-glutamate methylesterase [Bacillota bacterium]|nr:chemotaxis response regulator protein-glutamate methylesterase [Bacillota bacterium]